MPETTPVVKQEIGDIIKAYYAGWPDEHFPFMQAWGFFDALYNGLYPGDQNTSAKIGQFALDYQAALWDTIAAMTQVRQIVEQACVGDAGKEYEPSERVRVATQVLRSYFGLSAETTCQNVKCQSRRTLCREYGFPSAPASITRETAEYLPFGALLMIIDQVHHNLFHGSKLGCS